MLCQRVAHWLLWRQNWSKWPNNVTNRSTIVNVSVYEATSDNYLTYSMVFNDATTLFRVGHMVKLATFLLRSNMILGEDTSRHCSYDFFADKKVPFRLPTKQ